MLSLSELRTFASTMLWPAFERQVGPFALVQRPPDAIVQQRALALGAQRTVLAPRAFNPTPWSVVLAEFDGLLVATLPPLGSGEALIVGRSPDTELVIDDPSVSKRHAMVRWEPATRRCLLADLGSTNGTLVNERPVGIGEQALQDGDAVAFGDAEFWYLTGPTLYASLTAGAR